VQTGVKPGVGRHVLAWFFAGPAVDLGFWLSVALGLGVAGHAVVVLTSPLANPTRSLWSKFGTPENLLRLNGSLLLLASVLHLGVSWIKANPEGGMVLAASILPFPFFIAAGFMEQRLFTGAWHHIAMVAGFVAFAWHGTMAN
jgi:hypothetical protein